MSIGAAGGIKSSTLAFGEDQLTKCEDHKNNTWGFGVAAILMFFSAMSFFLASSLYIKSNAKSSLLIGFFQVIGAAYRNKHLELPLKNNNVLYRHKKGSPLVFPSDKLRFLNKACMIKDPQQAQPLTKTSNFMDPLYSRSSTEAKSTTQSDPNIQQG
ncbi:hypothetical protein LguiB_012029 [Lonicera macranthoides]